MKKESKKEPKLVFKKGNKYIACLLKYAYKEEPIDQSMAKLLFESVKSNKPIALKPTRNVLDIISQRKEYFSIWENVSLALTYANRIHVTFIVKDRVENNFKDKYEIYLEPNRKEITAFAEIGHIYIKLSSYEGKVSLFDCKNRKIKFHEMNSNEKNVVVDLEKHVKLTEIFFSNVR